MASVFKGLNVKIDAVSVWIGGYIMRIQAANTFYTGTYSVLNTKSSFPYAVKVEGYGNTRNQRSLFQFAHVTITEHMVNAKYDTKITNGPRVQMQTAGSKKKEDWTEVSKEQLAATEKWINEYPRKIFGYKSSAIMFQQCLNELGIAM